MIGKRIKDLRTHKGITQEAVSKALGVSSQAVSKWEQGITSPDISLLVPIADYFGVSLDALLRENYDAHMANPEDLVKIRVEKLGRYWRFHVKNISEVTLRDILLKVLFWDSEDEVIDYFNKSIFDLEPGMSCPELAISSMAESVSRVSVTVTSVKLGNKKPG